VNKREYRVSFGLRLRRFTLKTLARLVFHVLGNIKVTGRENIPTGQPYVVAINHISIFDPPFALAFWPTTLEAVGASNVFDKPFQGQLLELYGVIPVHRGEYDRKLIEIMLAMLRSGFPLMIAPEGGRSHATAMRVAKPGVAYVLDEARVPILPVGIIGTTGDFMKDGLSFRRRHTLELRIGKAITLPPIEGRGEARRAARQHNADVVMQHIAGLLPPEYRGVYADSAIFPSNSIKTA
jgi:1-acyl-sn-glycerol-3-phosphate acyltransferase